MRMDTQTIVTIAVAINVGVALLAIAAPRFGRRRPSRSMALAAATATGSSVLRESAGSADGAIDGESEWPPSDSADVDAAWSPDRPAGDGERAGRLGPRAATAEATWDPETGLALAASWSRWIAEEEARVRRFHRPATIVLVELGGLDRLVDLVGREAGQRLIPPIAITMRRYGRETDHFARIGRARFAAVLTETDEVQAINYVERIRTACDVWLAAGAVSLRLAIGWAEISLNQAAADAVRLAEERLFVDRQRSGSGGREAIDPADATDRAGRADSGS
jgi:diguanylate cyclase (GGDEF)-like protein